jgi:hypothetical protein
MEREKKITEIVRTSRDCGPVLRQVLTLKKEKWVNVLSAGRRLNFAALYVLT